MTPVETVKRLELNDEARRVLGNCLAALLREAQRQRGEEGGKVISEKRCKPGRDEEWLVMGYVLTGSARAMTRKQQRFLRNLILKCGKTKCRQAMTETDIHLDTPLTCLSISQASRLINRLLKFDRPKY